MTKHMGQPGSAEPTKSGKGPLIPILIGVVVVALGVVGYLFATGFFTPKVEVPELGLLSQEEAEQALTAAGLKVGTVSEKEDPAGFKVGGFVIEQDPAAQTSVPQGSAVNIVLSIGFSLDDPVTVPDLTGLTPEEAEEKLLDAMLIPQPGGSVYNDQVEPGKVCAQSTVAGTQLSMLETVTYQTSLGKEKVAVPDVVGKNVKEARDILTQAGLSVDTTQVYNDNVAAENVISQSVAKDEQVDKGTTVTIEVSLGKKPAAKVSVPNVLTYDLDSAKRTLESAGLAYRVVGDDSGTIVAIRPNYGSQVDQGSTVEIEVKRVQQVQPQQQQQQQQQPKPEGQEELTDEEVAAILLSMPLDEEEMIDLATSTVLERKGLGSDFAASFTEIEEAGEGSYIVTFDINENHYRVAIDSDTGEILEIVEYEPDGTENYL